MPDVLGATVEEIAHYEKVLKAAQIVMGILQTSSLDNKKFDSAIQSLEAAYAERVNPHIWANSTGKSPLFDFPRFVKGLKEQGIYVDYLPELQKEMKAADDNLRVMKSIREQNIKRMLPNK